MIAMLVFRAGRQDGPRGRKNIAASGLVQVAMRTIAMRVLRMCGRLPRRPIVVITVLLAAQQRQLCHLIACLVLQVGKRVGTKPRRTSVAVMEVRHATHTIAQPGYRMGGPLASWSGAAKTRRLDARQPMGRCSLIARLGQQIGRRVGMNKKKIIAAKWGVPSAKSTIARRV